MLQQGKKIELCPQEEETADVKWVDMEEYFSQPLWLSSPVYKKMNEVLTDVEGKIHPALTALRSSTSETDQTLPDAGVITSKNMGGNKADNGHTFAYRSNTCHDMVGFIGKKWPVGFQPDLVCVWASNFLASCINT